MFVGFSALAQVNLDRPLPVENSDRVYMSSVDTRSYYFFPRALHAVSAPVFSDSGSHLCGRFDVAVLKEEQEEVRAKVRGTSLFAGLHQYLLRGLLPQIDNSNYSEIDASFAPQLEALNDPGVLNEPVAYRLCLLHRHRLFKNLTRAEFARLFEAPDYKAIGILSFQFEALLGSETYLAQTALPLMVGQSPEVGEGAREGSQNHSITSRLNSDHLQIVLDEKLNCWSNPRPAQICLRPLNLKTSLGGPGR
jgi:hypothetical protein